MNAKRMLTAVLFGLLIAGLVFASGEQESSGAAGEQELRILWWGGQARHEKTLEVVDMYQGSKDEVTVEPEYLGWSGYWDRLAVLAAADDMPDVVQMVIERLPQYDERGLLMDLNEVSGLDPSILPEGLQEAGSVNGKLVAACLGTNAYALAYNPDLFDQAGVEYPTVDWTWEDAAAASKVFREELDIYGLNAFSADNDFLYWIRQHGAQLYSDDLTTVGWNDDQIVVDFFEQILDWQEKRYIPPAEYQIQNRSNEENSLYAQGEAAMMLMWSNKVVSVRQTLGRDSELMVLPGPNNEQGMYLRPSMFFSISSTSDVPDLAGDFVDYFLTDDDANIVLNADRGVPIVPSVRETLKANADSQNVKIFDYIALVSEHSSPMDTNFPKNEAELNDTFDQIVEQVSFGEISPEDGANRLREEWNTILGRQVQ